MSMDSKELMKMKDSRTGKMDTDVMQFMEANLGNSEQLDIEGMVSNKQSEPAEAKAQHRLAKECHTAMMKRPMANDEVHDKEHHVAETSQCNFINVKCYQHFYGNT